MLGRRRAAAVRPLDRAELGVRSGRRVRGHLAPRVGPERDHEVHASRRDVGGPQAPERGDRLRGAHARAQIELQEVMGVRSLGEDPELRKDERHGAYSPGSDVMRPLSTAACIAW